MGDIPARPCGRMGGLQPVQSDRGRVSAARAARRGRDHRAPGGRLKPPRRWKEIPDTLTEWFAWPGQERKKRPVQFIRDAVHNKEADLKIEGEGVQRRLFWRAHIRDLFDAQANLPVGSPQSAVPVRSDQPTEDRPKAPHASPKAQKDLF